MRPHVTTGRRGRGLGSQVVMPRSESERKERGCSRCEGGWVKGYFKFPPWFLSGEAGHCPPAPHSSLYPKGASFFVFWDLSNFLKVCFHFSDGNSPLPPNCPKPSGHICGNGARSREDRLIVLLEEPNSELHNNAFPH